MNVPIFEQRHRGDVWRLEVSTHEGRTFGNWRKWYLDGETLKPTRQGVTIPLERLEKLLTGLEAYFGAKASDGLPSLK